MIILLSSLEMIINPASLTQLRYASRRWIGSISGVNYLVFQLGVLHKTMDVLVQNTQTKTLKHLHNTNVWLENVSVLVCNILKTRNVFPEYYSVETGIQPDNIAHKN